MIQGRGVFTKVDHRASSVGVSLPEKADDRRPAWGLLICLIVSPMLWAGLIYVVRAVLS